MFFDCDPCQDARPSTYSGLADAPVQAISSDEFFDARALPAAQESQEKAHPNGLGCVCMGDDALQTSLDNELAVSQAVNGTVRPTADEFRPKSSASPGAKLQSRGLWHCMCLHETTSHSVDDQEERYVQANLGEEPHFGGRVSQQKHRRSSRMDTKESVGSFIDVTIDENKTTHKVSNPNRYRSQPPPPDSCWDTDDLNFLDKVRCQCEVRLTKLEPKDGYFEAKVRFNWTMRTLYSAYERTEPRVQIPGVRVPKMITIVHESRIWRQEVQEDSSTMLWKGVTDMTMKGFEIFEVQEFPYDRQLINLDVFDFLWRTDAESDNFVESMKLVQFEVFTRCLLPQWDTFPALVNADEKPGSGTGPTYSSRFVVRLRIQRKAAFYILQIYLVALLILIGSVLPMQLAVHETLTVGYRLGLHAAGLLTLVSFKHGVAEECPVVPYSTFTTRFLNRTVMTVVFATAETVLAQHLYRYWDVNPNFIDVFEGTLLAILTLAWISYWIYCAVGKERIPWEDVIHAQSLSEESHEHEESNDHDGGTHFKRPSAAVALLKDSATRVSGVLIRADHWCHAVAKAICRLGQPSSRSRQSDKEPPVTIGKAC